MVYNTRKELAETSWQMWGHRNAVNNANDTTWNPKKLTEKSPLNSEEVFTEKTLAALG